jgi:propanediol dehydratase large subunit
VAGGISFRRMGPAKVGSDPHEVVIGVSPAFGTKLFRTMSGIPIDELIREIVAGIEEGGGVARIVRLLHTADTSFLGLSAARLSGSKVGIGLQTKGTAVIHHADRLPHNNLELFSNAPITSLKHYRGLGFNAARYALNDLPEPVVVPNHGEAMGSRYHARVALIYAIETSLAADGAAPEELEISFAEASA